MSRRAGGAPLLASRDNDDDHGDWEQEGLLSAEDAEKALQDDDQVSRQRVRLSRQRRITCITAVAATTVVIIIIAFALKRHADASLCPYGTCYHIDTAPNDNAKYVVVDYASGFRAVLVSDPVVGSQLGASVTVSIGSFADPDSTPGLAHLLEHMLFLGTTKYPTENEFQDTVQKQSGGTNAYTDNENTQYYFSAMLLAEDPVSNAEMLLDRFAQFFISPTLRREAISQEAHNVASENDKNLKQDPWRLDQLLRSTSNTQHPYHRFRTGSLETLLPNKDRDTHALMLNLHSNYYRAKNMRLAVVSALPLEEMQKIIAQTFADLPTGGVDAPVLQSVPARLPTQLGVALDAQLLAHNRIVSLYWFVDNPRLNFGSKASEWIVHMLTRKDEGSLFQLLRGQLQIDSIDAGFQLVVTQFGLFTIDLTLTAKGMDECHLICQHVFEYLEMLRKMSIALRKEVWDERAAQARANFNFRKHSSDLQSYAKDLALNLAQYPLRSVIKADYDYTLFDSTEIDRYLNSMTADTMVLLTGSPVAMGTTKWDKTEKWYGTKYEVTPLSNESLTKWNDPTLNKALTPAKANPYIATSFASLHTCAASGHFASIDSKPPTKLVDDPNMRLWFKPDNEFCEPRACIFIDLLTPVPNGSATVPALRQSQRISYWIMAIERALTPLMYVALSAGITTQISAVRSGLRVTVFGWSEKIVEYVDKLLQQLRQSKVDGSFIESFRDSLLRGAVNFNFTNAFDQPVKLIHSLLEENTYTADEVYAELMAMPNETAADLEQLRDEFFARMYAEVLVHGNLAKKHAMAIQKAIRDRLKYQGLPKAEWPRFHIFQPPAVGFYNPTGSRKSYVSPVLVREGKDANSVSYNLFEVGESIGEAGLPAVAKTNLLVKLVNGPMFKELRTKQQLGYVVEMYAFRSDNFLFIGALVQSSTHDPIDLDHRVTKFIESNEAALCATSPEDLLRDIASSKAALLAPLVSAHEDATSVWIEIATRQYLWKRKKIEAAVYDDVNVTDLCSAYKATFTLPYPNDVMKNTRRKLSILTFGTGKTIPAPLGKDGMLPFKSFRNRTVYQIGSPSSKPATCPPQCGQNMDHFAEKCNQTFPVYT